MKSRNHAFLTLAALFLLVVMANIWSAGRTDEFPVEPAFEEKIKGVSWEASDSVALEHLQSLQPISANWIAQTPFGWQRMYDEPELRFDGQRGYWGERDEGLAKTGDLARRIGVKTMLKPHLWLGRETRELGKWRSDIAMQSEADWQAWFANYEAFILHYARLAEAEQFDMLCIGTELYQTAVQREADWRALIAKVRQVYSGKLTYAANFYEEYERIRFWDALDLIGIQAYYPLTDSHHPTLDELLRGWQPHYKRINALRKKWKKPVLFTEVGYRSMPDAAVKPWEWPNGKEVKDDLVSPQTQALCYEAMFRTFWREDWLQGIFLWKWSRSNYHPEGLHDRHARTEPISFTPKKEGLEVLKEWFE